MAQHQPGWKRPRPGCPPGILSDPSSFCPSTSDLWSLLASWHASPRLPQGSAWVSAPGPDHLWTLSSVQVGEASWEDWQVIEDLPASQWSPYHHDMDQALPCIPPISVTLCTCHSECLVLLPKGDRRVISEQTSPTQTGLRRSLHCTNTMDSGQAAVGGVGAQGYPVLACPAGLAAHCLDQSCFASTLGEK